jgi:transposase-like protein
MTKGEQARLMAWRLRVLHQAADQQNVARVCRRFGISRKSFYKWKRRHTEHGDAGLATGHGRRNARPRSDSPPPGEAAREGASHLKTATRHTTFSGSRSSSSLRCAITQVGPGMRAGRQDTRASKASHDELPHHVHASARIAAKRARRVRSRAPKPARCLTSVWSRRAEGPCDAVANARGLNRALRERAFAFQP